MCISRGGLKDTIKARGQGQGHKQIQIQGQGQGHKQHPRPKSRPRTDFPRTDHLKAMDMNARGQGQGHNAKVFFKKKKSSRKKLQIFCKISEEKEKVHDHGLFLTNQKNSAVVGREQGIFEDLEASTPKT